MTWTVGIVYNHLIPEAIALSQQLRGALKDLGKDVWLVKAHDLDHPRLQPPPLQLIITLGGDGTILRAARLAAPQQAVVLGVNMGQLGFLAELGPKDVLAQLPVVVAGGGWVEERMMLRATIHSNGATAVHDGLNDVVVTRGGRPRAIRVSVSIDDQHLQTYVADGVIVSTPTGSTAYALAMDGPIVYPELRALQVTPIAPHLTVVKAIIVPPAATVALTVDSKEPTVASVDGQIDTPLADGAIIHVTAGPHVARFVRLQARSYFYQTLVNRLSTTIVRRLQ
jgi:NAD+ kinase